MGKTTVSSFLLKSGIVVVDTDQLARRVVEPEQPAWTDVRSAFGPDIVGSDGRIRRDKLAQIVFNDDRALRQLERILHPRIRVLWMAEAEQWRTEKRTAGVVVIPLLFETKAEEQFEATICVACSKETQRTRLGSRGWSAEHINRRLEAQWAIEIKMERSDYVLWTDGSYTASEDQLLRIRLSEGIGG